MIWRRLAENAPDPARRLYFGLQAERMQRYEGHVCRNAAQVIAVSAGDAAAMRKLFGAARVSAIPTGVDLDYFRQPAGPARNADLIFTGSMDWMPNIDAMRWFVSEVLPLIRRRRPATSLAIVGRTPPPELQAWGRRDPLIQVSGTVPDVRPYLWGSAIAIVPLRIGGGTRLKIYEAMAARIPVVSTSIGAEGLTIHPPQDIRLADTPAAFAEECLALLDDPAAHERIASAAWEMVSASFSWEHVVREFEKILESARR
jgi:glycosyltransferase involved in cell wall biosynthesis